MTIFVPTDMQRMFFHVLREVRRVSVGKRLRLERPPLADFWMQLFAKEEVYTARSASA
jgi:hypothetical protein